MTTHQTRHEDAEGEAAKVDRPETRTGELPPEPTEELGLERDEDVELEPTEERGLEPADEPQPEPTGAEPGTADERQSEPIGAEPGTADELQAEPVGEPSGAHDGAAEDFAPEGASEIARQSALVEADDYESRWSEIQIGFVDEPRGAVQSAGALVADLMDELTRAVDGELTSVASRASSDDSASTEDLRLAFQRYRELFDRLVAV
jgi:hypothetical protein